MNICVVFKKDSMWSLATVDSITVYKMGRDRSKLIWQQQKWTRQLSIVLSCLGNKHVSFIPHGIFVNLINALFGVHQTLLLFVHATVGSHS